MLSSLSRWFRSPRRTVMNRAAGRTKTTCKLHLEPLEDRIVPATSVFFDDMAIGMAVDSLGNQYVNYGILHGTVDLDPDPARTTSVTGFAYTDSGHTNGQFLVKYSPLQEVLWIKSAAANELPGSVNGLKVGLDAGVEYLYTFGSSVTKMNLDGTVVWSNATSASVSSSVIDADGSIYTSGTFNSSADLDTGTVWPNGRDQVTANGQGEFVAKWAADGTLQWSRAISAAATGGDPSPAVWSGATTSNFGTIAVANGVVYAGGMYRGTLSLGGLTNDRIDSASTSPDGFVATYDTDGNFKAVAHFVDADVSSVRAVGSDVYMTAQFGYTADLDPGPGRKLLTPGNINGENLAVARLGYNPGPTPTWTLSWADKFISSGDNLGGGLEVSGTDLYVSGEFGGTTDFDPSSATYNLSAGGGEDIFAMKLTNNTGALAWVSQMGSTRRLAVGPGQETAGLALTPTGIYLAGFVVHGTVNFVGPDRNVVKIMDAGLDRDAFVAKLGTDGRRQWSFGVGVVGRTMDDGDPGYAESGSGWKASSLGFDGESRTHAKGNGSNTATWTFTGLPNGLYQVVTRFPASNKNASNAPFRVNGSLVTVDQTTAPNDVATEYDGLWKNLGTVAVTNGTLTVVLSDAANGTVVADAMRIWVAASPRIGSFTAGPNPVTAGSSVTLTAANITDANPGSTITQVSFYVDSNGDGVLDAGDTLLTGTSTYSNGTWTLTFATTGWAPGRYKLFVQAQDSYGVFSDPLALDLQVL